MTSGDVPTREPADSAVLASLAPEARRAVIDRFLAEAHGAVRDAMAAAAAADADWLSRVADGLAADADALGLIELSAAAAALARAGREGAGEVGAPLVALARAWDDARALLARARA